MNEIHPTGESDSVRWAQMGDAEAILSLTNELIIASNSKFENKLTVSALRENLFSCSPKAEVIVYESEGEVVGCLIFTRGYGPWMSISSMMINAISVSNKNKNKGIGSRLLKFAESIAHERGWPRLELYTDSNYPKSKEFYERLGFTFYEVSYGKKLVLNPLK